jgi:hypothetical protein
MRYRKLPNVKKTQIVRYQKSVRCFIIRNCTCQFLINLLLNFLKNLLVNFLRNLVPTV